MTCTNPRMVAIIAYLEWLNNPTMEKKIFENRIKTKWYNIIESTDSSINILGPHTKLRLKTSWKENNRDKNIGAATVVGLGIRNTSFVNILNKSANIWKAPFLPIRVGPILLWAKASILRSVRTINKTIKTHVKDKSRENSWIVF